MTMKDLRQEPFVQKCGSMRSLVGNNDEQILMIPGTMGFKSAHTLINKERAARGVASLIRSTWLDRLCRFHAQVLAREGCLEHCVETADDLKQLLKSRHAGVNVQRGRSVASMHRESMQVDETGHCSTPGATNLLGEHYREFGVGTALGKDGNLYMVQLFRGDEPRRVPNNDKKEKEQQDDNNNKPEASNE